MFLFVILLLTVALAVLAILYLKQHKQLITARGEVTFYKREFSHRINNQLQIINSLLSVYETKANRTELEEIKTKISSIAQLHRRVYQEGGEQEIFLKDYLTALLEDVLTIFNWEKDTEAFRIRENKQIRLDMDTAASVGLLVVELVTNSIKHLRLKQQLEPIIEIELHEDGNNTFLLQYSDNGKVRMLNNEVAMPSTGMQLVYAIVEKMYGEVVHNSPNNFVIKFRNNKYVKEVTALGF